MKFQDINISNKGSSRVHPINGKKTKKISKHKSEEKIPLD